MTNVHSLPESPEFTPFWRHVAERRLCFPMCRSCGRRHWYPLPRCPHCLAADIDWEPVGPDGTLFSWTAVNHAFTPEFAGKVPYTVGLIAFAGAPGVRLITEVRAPPARALRIDMPVRAVFTGRTGAEGLHFVPATT